LHVDNFYKYCEERGILIQSTAKRPIPELAMRAQSRKERARGKFAENLKSAACLLVLMLVYPMSQGVFLPGRFLFFSQIIAVLLLGIFLLVVIVGSRNHIKRKRAEAEKLKKDDPSE